MKYSTAFALLAFTASSMPITSAAYAEDGVPLSQVAARLGYAYAYLGPEDAVQLSRPGLTILVRPGEKLIDVNDRTETMNMAPRFDRNELYVSDSFVSRLRELMREYPVPAARSGESDVLPADLQPRHAEAVPNGAISGLDVRQLWGTQSLTVSGHAPPAMPITLTVKETFWTDVPDVVLSRNDVTSNADGRFDAVVPVAPGYFYGGIITVVATSLPPISDASAQIVLKAPNDNVDIPAQQVPKWAR